MAMLRYGHASVVHASITSDDWTNKIYKGACKDGQCRMKTAKSIIAKYSPNKYLLSHVTIIASVDVDQANPKDPKSDYLIKPEFSNLVNNNGDAWTREVLKNSYQTFIGGENYLEHVQIPELSKGKIIDAVLREIPIGKDKEGKELTTLYCDILVATDRKHDDLVHKIESKELTTLSMGCLIKYSICSKCGNRAIDETQACDHIRYQKNNTFFDENGVQRKIAELCGYHDDPESVRFIEASWVKQPAFTGAVLRSFVAPSEEIMAKIEKAEKMDVYKKKPGDYLKAASLENIIAQDPPEKEAPPDEPEDTPPEEPADEPKDDATPEEPAPDDSAVGEEPALPEGMEEDEFKSWKKDLKRQVLRQISDEVMKGLSEDDETGPRNTDTLDETLIKPASLVMNKIWGAQKSWDRFINQKAGSLNKKAYDKLRYGLHIAMTNSDLTLLSKFGYSKRDFLAVLSFIDGCRKNPLPIKVKKTIASLGGTKKKSARELLTKVVADLGRKITQDEAHKILSWLKLLNYYKD
jgi:hypothetical protein